ncbi:MAG: benzoyl-CoA-dihydrodiol lyase [Planctomycetota bacterium]|nr:MAG: benzoyl-CoA-dihydrodiol lyase [Planctomycetota bacterium]
MTQNNFNIQTHPSQYRHWRLEIQGSVAWLFMQVQEDAGVRPGYQLKLNSYDIGVDFELADAVNRLRFEHPEVKVVCIESGRQDIFCAGANIYMLSQSSHSHKVNFCKFTNETRIHIEEATKESGQTYVASLNGGTAGGGYELALACHEIFLINDRKSAVSLPEVPLLGVLPGTGGLTRLVDKRKVRRDLADIFCTTAEGVRGEKALKWGLVDHVYPPSQYKEKVEERIQELLREDNCPRPEKGITLEPLVRESTDTGWKYSFLKVEIDGREAILRFSGPREEDLEIPSDPAEKGSSWYPLALWREFWDALWSLKLNYEEVGLVSIYSEGDLESILALDEELWKRREHWFIREILLHMRRVLRSMDITSKSFYTFIIPGSCFGGSLFEIALASDRIYMLDHPDEPNYIGLSSLNQGFLTMYHGLSRLENRFYENPQALEGVWQYLGKPLSPLQAEELGLVTEVMDDIDWDDEIRVAREERLSLSPDALTGMEANLRFVGPETMESRIFGRLSAWQNWIFTRPNATGPKGALTCYGKAENPEFDWRRT